MLFCCIAVTIAFIWIHSMVPRPVSAAESGRFVELLRPLFASLHIGDDLADHIIRKWAHFTEYAGLGGELGVLWFVERIRGAVGAVGEEQIKYGFNESNAAIEEMNIKTTFNKRAFTEAIHSVTNKVIYIAVIDETIQIFSLRGSQVSDVCLDFVGGLFGGMVAYALCRWVAKRR